MPVLFAAGILISAFTIRRGIEYFDDGLALQAAARVADGQLPYRDFTWAYGPAHPLLLGGLFEALGPSLMWPRIVRVLCDAGVALVVFALVRREAPWWAAGGAWLAAAAAMAQPAGANPFAPALLFGLLGVLAGARGAPRWAGACVALAAAFRLDFGFYAALGAAVALLAGRARARALAAFAAVAGLGTALALLPFAVTLGPADLWEEIVGRSLREGGSWRLPFPLEYEGGLGSPEGLKDALGFYVPLLLVTGLAAALAAFAVARRRPSPAAAGLAGLGVGALAYMLSRTDEFHTAPLLVVTAALLALALAPRGGVRPVLAGVLVLLVAYGGANRLSALLRPPELAPVDIAVADGVRAAPAEARDLARMVAAVQRRVPAGEPIYSVTRRSDLVRINNPMVWVVTERPNPTRSDFALQTSAADQRALVARLAAVHPRVIVRWNSPASTRREPNDRGTPSGARVLDEWLSGEYRRAERHGFYEILERR